MGKAVGDLQRRNTGKYIYIINRLNTRGLGNVCIVQYTSETHYFKKMKQSKIFLLYLPTTPGNYLPTTPRSFLSADYPRPHGTTISRLPCSGKSGDSLHVWGSREIGGVYSRYFRGYWGSREIFAVFLSIDDDEVLLHSWLLPDGTYYLWLIPIQNCTC